MAIHLLDSGKISTMLRNRIVLRNANYIFRNFENYDNVSVYPRQRLIYNRIKKSGNTTITAFLNDALVGDSYGDFRDLKYKLVRPGDLTASELYELPNYYSFTFVRNPYDRALSAYLGAAVSRKGLPGVRVRNGFRRFQFNVKSKEHFHEFLEFLDSGGLYADRHWWPQADLLFQPAERFSFIGKLESIVRDMKTVLRTAGVNTDYSERLTEPHEIEKKFENKIQSAHAKTQLYYSVRARELVQKLYRRDFELFGYSAD
jgi:hypothetical protein